MEQDKSLPDFGRIPSLEELNDRSKNTLVSNLGIEYTEVKQGKVIAQMPVDERTKQPMGILHGGASLALAETVAGLGSMCLIDINTQQARGINVSASHVGGVSEGIVTAEATIIHQGETTHIWNVNITNSDGRLISTIRVTNMIISRR